MNRINVNLLTSFLLMSLAIGSSAGAEKGTASVVLPAGDVRSKFGFYSVVFYYAPDPAVPTQAAAKELVEKFLPGVPFVTDSKQAPSPPFVAIQEEKAPLEKFPVPPDSFFKYKGHGLTGENIAAFRKTTMATSLLLVAPRDDVWVMGRRFTVFAHEFAVQTKAYIWDSATREGFSPEAWQQTRLNEWKDTIPQISTQVTIDLYQSSDTSTYLRAVTLGMEKFALPDLVIEQLVGSDNRPGGNLINLVGQSLAETPRVTDANKRVIRISEIKNAAVRKKFEASFESGATGEITLALLVGRHDDGDAENSLVEIDFRNSPGRTIDERRAAALAKLWGSSDSIVGVKHDDELLAASQKARERLPELQATFAKGLPPGSRLLLKAPFQRDDSGNEWMWVEVMQWPKEGKVTGVLQNDPFYIRSLKAGAKVLINVSDVFDYILYRADGTAEGNTTGKLMEQRQPERISK
jgi:uncharacterized protein YegJ (DUF2314 family)